MSSRIQRSAGIRQRRSIAVAAALVLVAAQLLASAHFHRSRRTIEIGAGNADLVCAVCVVRAHAPAASIGTGAVFVPGLVRIASVPALRAGSLAPRLLRLSGRAPPASL